MQKRICTAVFVTLSFLVGSARATAMAWTPAQLDSLAQSFASGIASTYTVTSYPFSFLDTSECFQPDFTCGFSNPDSPYAFPQVNGVGAMTMMRTDAFVLIMETPPPMRYFALTPYVYTRYYAPNSVRVTQTGFVKVFESLADSVNMDRIGTTGSTTPGVNVNTKLSVIVMTADANTWKQVSAQFTKLGYPSSAINLLTLPVTAASLTMGTTSTSDTYQMLLRMAYPALSSQLSDYIARAPFRFYQLSALTPRNLNALPTAVSRVPGQGTVEPASLATSRDQLVEQLVAQYGAAYTVTELSVVDKQTTNYVCIQTASFCAGDNSDAIYTDGISQWVPGGLVNGVPEDKLLVVGVNHVMTGKAVYVNFAVEEDVHEVGVTAVADPWLQGTALEMAGINTSSDPRYDDYSQLYAFTVGYDCSGEIACMTIPLPTATQIGVSVGDPIDITGRYYVDPVTFTRPSIKEIVDNRVFLLQKKL